MTKFPETSQNAFIAVAEKMLDELPHYAARGRAIASGPTTAFGVRTRGYDAENEVVEAQLKGIIRPIKVLRDAMYEPGTGTWYRAKFTVTRSGEAEAEYDYDGEPDDMDIIDPTEWVFELRKYPRDAEHIPDWLRKNLDISYQAFPQLLAEDIAANRPWLTDADRRR